MSTVLAAGSITETVVSGPFLLAAGLALAAGFVSFASPCVLPLVPGYLSYLVGLVGSENTIADSGVPGRPGTRVRAQAVRATALFVVGFTAVFTVESMLLLQVSRFLVGNAELLTRIGGAVMVVMGMAMLGWVPLLRREIRMHARPTGRIMGAPILGAFFALGWTACLGPTLAGVNSLVVSSDWNGNAWRGLLLVILYCLGLGVPFLLLAYGFGWATTAIGFLRRHSRAIQIFGGAMMIAVGLAMLTGMWSDFISQLQQGLITNSVTPL